MKKSLFTLFFILSLSLGWAQNFTFGKVSKGELEEEVNPLDSEADAAVLYTERKTEFSFSYEEGFRIIEKYYTRIKIYTEEGYKYATKNILTYHNGEGKEYVKNIKAATYNLINGKISTTKLTKDKIYKENRNRYYNITKFTMPNLRPGCIVEWKYTFETPFLSMLNEVELQKEIPIMKLNTVISIPEYFTYKTKMKGYNQIEVKNKTKQRTITFNHPTNNKFSNVGRTRNTSSELSFTEKIYIINTENIPALIDEPFSGNIHNYMSSIIFELTQIRYPNGTVKNFSTTWENVVSEIYNSYKFGKELKKHNHFIKDLDSELSGITNMDDRILTVFQFVKNKIKWNGIYGYITDLGVDKAYKAGEGNVADINLNLIAMLQYAGIDADPVLLSTVKNGIPIFPTRLGFNYVIARAVSSKGVWLLDATEKNSMPNVLPNRDYNFQGRVINKYGNSEWIDLFPKEYSKKITTISVKYEKNGFTGTAKTSMNNNFAFEYRNTVQGKSKEEVIKWLEQKAPSIEITNIRLNNINDLNKKTIELIQFKTNDYHETVEKNIYINPLLFMQLSKNPFKQEKREYPIFYNKPWVTSSIIHISIPEEYSITNIPSSDEFKLPDNLGLYKYTTTKNKNIIEIQSTLLINSPVILAKYYQEIKDFYKKIIAKQAERIILTRK